MSLSQAIPLDKIRYNEQGLVPAIAQDYLDGTVLMMAWMNRESLAKTLETEEALAKNYGIKVQLRGISRKSKVFVTIAIVMRFCSPSSKLAILPVIKEKEAVFIKWMIVNMRPQQIPFPKFLK